MKLPEVPELSTSIDQKITYYPYNIAMIIDNVVYQVFNVGDQEAAQFMSQPLFVQVGFDAKVGWIYKDGEVLPLIEHSTPKDIGL